MAISVITGLSVDASEPADAKETVATSVQRLQIVYPYKGLRVTQLDNLQVYKYITTTPVDGSLPLNGSGDWEIVPQLRTGAGVPATSLGSVNDVYIDETNFIVYRKTGASTWTSLFSISGSKILNGTGVPSNSLGSNADLYLRSDVPNNGDIYLKAAGVWTFQFTVAGVAGASGDRYATSSVTSINLTSLGATTTITIGLNLAYTVGQTAICVSASAIGDNFTGIVTSYNTGTGVLSLEGITKNGTATKADWQVNLAGVSGVAGKALLHTDFNVNLTDALVTTVQAGGYTKQNPWSASVANDTRTNLNSPVTLAGSMGGNSISYDGASWINNGRWQGFNGIQGIQGIQGIPGLPGTSGTNGINAVVRFYNSINLPSGVIPQENFFLPVLVQVMIENTMGNITLPFQNQGTTYYHVTISSLFSYTITRAGTNTITNKNGVNTTSIVVPAPSTLPTTSGRPNQNLAIINNDGSDNGWCVVALLPEIPVVPEMFVSTDYDNSISTSTTAISSFADINFNQSRAFGDIFFNNQNSRRTRPLMIFTVRAFGSGGNAIGPIASFVILRSSFSDMSFPTEIKRVNYSVSGGAAVYQTFVIQVIDNFAPKTYVWYRLVVTNTTSTSGSNIAICTAYEYLAYPVIQNSF